MFFEFLKTVMGPLDLTNSAVSPEILLRLVTNYSFSSLSQPSFSKEQFIHFSISSLPIHSSSHSKLHNYCFLSQGMSLPPPKVGVVPGK